MKHSLKDILTKSTIKEISVITSIMVLVLLFQFLKGDELRDFRQINKKGELRVVTDYSSLSYFIAGDTVMGFQYEIVNKLCKKLKLNPVWVVENSLDRSIDMLNAGKVDVIARNIPITSELRKKLAFSEPIIQLPQVLVQRKAEFNNGIEPIRNQLLLAGKKVYVPENSPNILRLKNLADEIADTIIVKQIPHYESEQLMMMVANGDIDFAVCDLQVAKRNTLLMPQLDISTAVSFPQLQAWAMRPDAKALQEEVNGFLHKFLQTKAFRDIYRRYFK